VDKSGLAVKEGESRREKEKKDPRKRGKRPEKRLLTGKLKKKGVEKDAGHRKETKKGLKKGSLTARRNWVSRETQKKKKKKKNSGKQKRNGRASPKNPP